MRRKVIHIDLYQENEIIGIYAPDATLLIEGYSEKVLFKEVVCEEIVINRKHTDQVVLENVITNTIFCYNELHINSSKIKRIETSETNTLIKNSLIERIYIDGNEKDKGNKIDIQDSYIKILCINKVKDINFKCSNSILGNLVSTYSKIFGTSNNSQIESCSLYNSKLERKSIQKNISNFIYERGGYNE